MIRASYRALILALLCMVSMRAFAKSPDCTNPEAWPAGMAFTQLKNAGVVDNDILDFTKTKVIRLASEKVGKDIYRQVHLVRFFKKSGEQVEVITVNEASHQECSLSDVNAYLISRQLDHYPEQK
jgi:hypothetical protein